jgi:hypothetical protein
MNFDLGAGTPRVGSLSDIAAEHNATVARDARPRPAAARRIRRNAGGSGDSDGSIKTAPNTSALVCVLTSNNAATAGVYQKRGASFGCPYRGAVQSAVREKFTDPIARICWNERWVLSFFPGVVAFATHAFSVPAG